MIHHIEPEDRNKEQDEPAQNKTASEAAEPTDSGNGQANQKPLTTQGTQEEIEENLGGTTNLSLDQLKKEGDAGH
ncbi:hypothetical protein [Arcticibacter sp.]|jgi:hypothetical protein|uniref:hypothetical protein n=1 Tax=Arcticibacter sp. TaxID=1872630 RepID=UPI00388F8EC7